MSPQHETTDSESSAVIRPNNPAANAVRHGFCAKKILTPETYARAEVIREELTRIHEPWSNEEIDAIATLSIARAQQFELELAMRAKVDIERAKCAEIHERNAEHRFEIDLANFRDKPEVYGSALSMTWHGTDWLRKLWQRIAELLTPDSSGERGLMPFHLACDAAAAIGGPWQVDRAGSEAAWMMARFVRISPEPEAAIELWANQSNALDGRKFALKQAHWLVGKAPADPDIAAAELHCRATGELSRITQLVNKLRSNYETELANAAEAAVGTGSGDPAMEKEFRLLTRYLTSARNRGDKLERRLDLLKRDRKRLAYRLQRDTEEEVRRLKRESEKALTRYEREIASDSHGSLKYHMTISRPDNGIPPDDSRSRDFDSRDVEISHSGSSLQPVESNVPSARSIVQTIDPKEDSVELRNDSARDAIDVSEQESSTPADAMSTPEAGSIESIQIDLADLSGWEMPSTDAQAVAERAKLVELTANGGSFAQRAQRMRYRDWSNKAEVQEDEAALLRNLKSLPDSFAQGATIRVLFGTQGTFRRAWRAYSTWADASLVAAAEEMHQSGGG
jgi:hypothetical protein